MVWMVRGSGCSLLNRLGYVGYAGVYWKGGHLHKWITIIQPKRFAVYCVVIVTGGLGMFKDTPSILLSAAVYLGMYGKDVVGNGY
jgi:hypothetical protein